MHFFICINNYLFLCFLFIQSVLSASGVQDARLIDPNEDTQALSFQVTAPKLLISHPTFFTKETFLSMSLPTKHPRPAIVVPFMGHGYPMCKSTVRGS